MNQINILLLCRKKLFLLIGIIGLIMLFSCKKEEVEPYYKNSVIKGEVRLYDYGTIIEDKSNIKITAYGPYGNKSAFTDYNGLFEISELGNGTYEVEFYMYNYETTRLYGIQLFGYDTVQLFEILSRN